MNAQAHEPISERANENAATGHVPLLPAPGSRASQKRFTMSQQHPSSFSEFGPPAKRWRGRSGRLILLLALAALASPLWTSPAAAETKTYNADPEAYYVPGSNYVDLRFRI